jgi:hypothetical protein
MLLTKKRLPQTFCSFLLAVVGRDDQPHIIQQLMEIKLCIKCFRNNWHSRENAMYIGTH